MIDPTTLNARGMALDEPDMLSYEDESGWLVIWRAVAPVIAQHAATAVITALIVGYVMYRVMA